MRKNQSKKHTGYLRGRCVNSFKVPDSLGRVRKMVSEETSAIFSVESRRETLFVPGKRTKIADLHCKEISWLGGRPISIQHADWATQAVGLDQYIENSRSQLLMNFHENLNFRKTTNSSVIDGLTTKRSTDLTSTAESLSPIWPPVQSTISTRKTSPVVTSATGGISGCHR